MQFSNAKSWKNKSGQAGWVRGSQRGRRERPEQWSLCSARHQPCGLFCRGSPVKVGAAGRQLAGHWLLHCWTIGPLKDPVKVECWGDGLEMWGHSHYLYSAALKYVWNQSKTCQQHVKPLSRMPGRRISVLTVLKVWRNTKQNLRGRAWLGLTVCQSWSRGQIVIWRWQDPVLLGTLATENRSGKSSEKIAEIVINSNCSIWF